MLGQGPINALMGRSQVGPATVGPLGAKQSKVPKLCMPGWEQRSLKIAVQLSVLQLK